MNQFSDIIHRLRSGYNVLITKSFKNLLESKHLYQSVMIDINSYLEMEKHASSFNPYETVQFADLLRYIQYPWATNIGKSYRTPVEEQAKNNVVQVNLPTIKIYCALCKRVEAFNPFSDEFSETQKGVIYPGSENQQVCQLFLLEYQCQSCKGTPEIFLVRKEGYRISLHGRSPMEVYPCPKVIPKAFRKYFSDSAVAFNSGQVLAALFLVRTFIEQFTRFKTKANDIDLVDNVLSTYMAKLPEDFKERFPSLKKIYSDLSSAIHRAEPNAELFSTVQNEIVEHFEARKLFKLT